MSRKNTKLSLLCGLLGSTEVLVGNVYALLQLGWHLLPDRIETIAAFETTL